MRLAHFCSFPSLLACFIPVSWPGLLQIISICPAWIHTSSWPLGFHFFCYRKNKIKTKQHHSGFICLTIPSYSPSFWVGVQAVSHSTDSQEQRGTKQSATCQHCPDPDGFLPMHAALESNPGAVLYIFMMSLSHQHTPILSTSQSGLNDSSLRFSFQMIQGWQLNMAPLTVQSIATGSLKLSAAPITCLVFASSMAFHAFRIKAQSSVRLCPFSFSPLSPLPILLTHPRQSSLLDLVLV